MTKGFKVVLSKYDTFTKIGLGFFFCVIIKYDSLRETLSFLLLYCYCTDEEGHFSPNSVSAWKQSNNQEHYSSK